MERLKMAGVWKRNLALWPGMAANSITSCHSRYQESKFVFAGLIFTLCCSWEVGVSSESSDGTGLVNAMCFLWDQGGRLFVNTPLHLQGMCVCCSAGLPSTSLTMAEPAICTHCHEEPWGFRRVLDLKGSFPALWQLSAPGLLPSPVSGTDWLIRQGIHSQRSAKIRPGCLLYRPALFFHLEFSLYSFV